MCGGAVFYCRWVSLTDIGFQRIDIFGKCLAPRVGHSTDRAGHLSAIGLLDVDVPRALQLVDLHTQVARRRARLLAQKDKIGTLDADQYRHHGQA